MKTPKTYKYFKVKYQYNDTAYLETALILEFKNPTTQREAKLICEKTYNTNNGFCVGISPEQVINHIKIGLTLLEVVKFKDIIKPSYGYITQKYGSLYTNTLKPYENFVIN